MYSIAKSSSRPDRIVYDGNAERNTDIIIRDDRIYRSWLAVPSAFARSKRNRGALV